MQECMCDADKTVLTAFDRAVTALTLWFIRPSQLVALESSVVAKARKELNNRNSAQRKSTGMKQRSTVEGSNVDIHQRRVRTEVQVSERPTTTGVRDCQQGNTPMGGCFRGHST